MNWLNCFYVNKKCSSWLLAIKNIFSAVVGAPRWKKSSLIFKPESLRAASSAWRKAKITTIDMQRAGSPVAVQRKTRDS